MATTKLYLDTRGIPTQKPDPLKLAVTHKGRTALISLGVHILPSQWDRHAGKIVANPNRQAINTYIGNRKQSADNILLKLLESGEIAGMDVAGIKRRITDGLCPDRREERDGLFASV